MKNRASRGFAIKNEATARNPWIARRRSFLEMKLSTHVGSILQTRPTRMAIFHFSLAVIY